MTMHIARATTIVLWLLAGAAPAAAFFEISGVFVADERCQALDSIRRETNPGNIVTVPSQSYTARALNREDGDWVFVDVPGASPPRRWVNTACGELFQSDTPPRPAPAPAPSAELRPFFDDRDDGPGDPTPRAPTLGAFDRAMLDVCGDWGSNPRAAAFRAVLDRPQLAADVERILKALSGAVTGEARDLARFKDELTTAWFDEQGFRHIFCGEPSGGNLGGLHFAGRYLEMQEKGWGGLADRCNTTEIAPPIYTFGVRYRIARGGLREACPKGYPLDLDASGILIEATRALKAMLPKASGKAMCLHRVATAGKPDYLAVFVIKNSAVRTFYPDASPSCDAGRPANTCLCEQ
jgi:hypothetical protein